MIRKLALTLVVAVTSTGCLPAIGAGVAKASTEIFAGLALAAAATAVNEATRGMSANPRDPDRAGDSSLAVVRATPQRAERSGDDERRWVAMEMGWYAPGFWDFPPIPSVNPAPTLSCGEKFSTEQKWSFAPTSERDPPIAR